MNTLIKNNILVRVSALMLGFTVATSVLSLAGCAAVQTSIAKRDLDVQTKMSDTIFLDPVSPDKKVRGFNSEVQS